jgi:hypothetical protein
MPRRRDRVTPCVPEAVTLSGSHDVDSRLLRCLDDGSFRRPADFRVVGPAQQSLGTR